ncbi:MAG: phosphate signaling complex protein PhoU [Calditrichia bacterium]
MPKRLQIEIDNLKKRILELGTVVEERVRMAVNAIHERDMETARFVMNGDPEIDDMEVDLEEECLKILALHQPLAVDLRYIIAVLKINNEMERIGDLAVNIAERATVLASLKPFEFPFDFKTMVDKTQDMLRRSLDSLVNLEADTAFRVCMADEEVDAINREMYAIVKKEVAEDPSRLSYLLHLLSVSRHLERIADHATNIAEDVIYLTEGEIVRHHPEQFHVQNKSEEAGGGKTKEKK